MYISKETELVIKLLQIPGIGSKMAEAVAKAMISFELLSDSDIESYVTKCIDTKFIRINKKISNNDFYLAIEKGHKIIDDSYEQSIKIISKFDDDFPVQLKVLLGNRDQDVSPLILNYKGNLQSILQKRSIAIVGTRNPTIEGEVAGQYYGKFFAEKGYNIVSGLALGCDTIAHQAALSVNGTTTAILAHGLHMISPKKHEQIAQEILNKGGLLLSEYFVGSPAFTTHFVERDRLQAGLSDATIVIQTGIKGGTMHAARTTMNNNKVLAAVKYKEPSIAMSENVVGNENLINKGAYQLRSAEDFYEYLQNGKTLQYKIDEPTFF